MEIGERIKIVREHEGLNQRDFASSIKIGQPTLAMFENGQRTPKDIHIEQICLKFNINEKWLRYGTGTMKKIPRGGKLAAYVSEITDGDDDFIQDLIEVYMELDETSKEALRKIRDEMIKRAKEREQK